MNTRTTFILLIVAAMAIAGIWFVESQTPDTETTKNLQKRILAEFDKDEIDKVELRKDGQTIFLLKEDGMWKLTDPVQDLADDGRVSSLLNDLESLEKGGPTVREPEEDLSQYGLDSPKTVLTASGGQKSYTIKLGGNAPGNSLIYLQMADNSSVYVTSTSFRHSLDKDASDFRNKDVFPYERDDITSMQLTRGKWTVATNKQQETWKLTQPADDRTDKGVVDRMLDKADFISIIDFIEEQADDLAQYGLEDPDIRWQVSAGKKSLELLIGDPVKGGNGDAESNHYAKQSNRPVIFTIAKWNLDAFPNTAVEIRDKRPLNIEADKVTSLHLEREGVNLKLSKEGDDWNVTVPREFKASSTAVDEVLDFLKDASALEFDDNPDQAALGLDQAATRLHVTAGEQTATLLIGRQQTRDDQTLLPVKADDESVVRMVSADVLAKIDKTHLDFYDRQRLQLDSQEITEINVNRADGSQFNLVKKDDNWHLTKPLAHLADRSNAESLRSAISYLDAERIVSDDPAQLGTYHLESPDVTVTVRTGTPNGDADTTSQPTERKPIETHHIALKKVAPQGEDAEASYFSWVKDTPYIFTVKQSTYDDCMAELYDTSLFPGSWSIDKVEIIIGSAGHTITKNGDDYSVIVGDQVQKGDADEVQKLWNGLSNLSASPYIDYAPLDLAEFDLDNPAVKVTVHTDKQEITMLIGGQDAEGYFAKRDDDPAVFRLPASKYRTITRPVATLIPEPSSDPPETDEQAEE